LLRLSIRCFERVLKLRPEEPQSYRDLALVLAKTGQLSDVLRALELLKEVITKQWDARFSHIELIALIELNRILAKVKGQFPNTDFVKEVGLADVMSGIPSSPIQCDIRVSLSWSSDMSDVELHVIEPNKDHCYSFCNHTCNGGIMTRDFTGGYGPIDYYINKAPRGIYQVKCALFYTPNPHKPVTVIARIYTNFGTEQEIEEIGIFTINTPKKIVVLGRVVM